MRLSADQDREDPEVGSNFLGNLAAGYRALEEPDLQQVVATPPRRLTLEIWLQILARVYSQVEADEHFSNLLAEVRDKYELRINLGPLLKALKHHPPGELPSLALRVEFKDNAYEAYFQ